jgi:hypothetical protein
VRTSVRSITKTKGADSEIPFWLAPVRAPTSAPLFASVRDSATIRRCLRIRTDLVVALALMGCWIVPAYECLHTPCLWSQISASVQSFASAHHSPNLTPADWVTPIHCAKPAEHALMCAWTHTCRPTSHARPVLAVSSPFGTGTNKWRPSPRLAKRWPD